MSPQSRLLFTFVASDLPLVRPFAESLRMSGSALTVDFSLTSEPFAAQRADYIRASLAVRIKRSLATICLFGPETFADDWVLWTLEQAHHHGRPIVGTPLTTSPAPEALDLLSALGATLLPPRAEVFTMRLAALPTERRPRPSDADLAVLTLRSMRHDAR